MTILFFHGVPDTPAMWQPLIRELGHLDKDVRLPALPGFGCPWPDHFIPTKEGYLDWTLKQIEDAATDADGPVDVVGHDWGALLTLRAASLRPDLIRTWAVANAILVSNYRWHDMARKWQTPLLGELVMALTPRAALSHALIKAGFPHTLAKLEVRHWNSLMKRSILSLYRSAKTVTDEWTQGLENLPKRGLILWGAKDPYIDIRHAKTFASQWSVPVHIEQDAGHWLIVENVSAVGRKLREHWVE